MVATPRPSSSKSQRLFGYCPVSSDNLDPPASLLEEVIDYVNGLPPMPGVPASIDYVHAANVPAVRLQTVCVQRVTDPIFAPCRETIWTKVKSPEQIEVKLRSSDIYDTVFGPVHK